MSTDDGVNPYELLDVKVESTEQEIRTAYRQRSLKVHPDRNRNNPDAARKFHELNQAYELLLDPLRRLALDAKIRLREAKKQRFANYDNKRKNLVQELEERERLFKKARTEKAKEEVAVWQQTEAIKEEGRKLREEKEKELQRLYAEQAATAAAAEKESDELEAPSIGSLDTTIRLKYALKSHAHLTTPESLSALLSPFGQMDTPVLSMKPPKKAPAKPPKFATALIPFKQIGDAFAAVCASGQVDRGLEGIEISWAGGNEPPILEWLKKMGKLGTPSHPPTPREGKSVPVSGRSEGHVPPQSRTKLDSANFSSFPDLPFLSAETMVAPAAGVDYEALTLMRLRQAEKERLEREIREQEENE